MAAPSEAVEVKPNEGNNRQNIGSSRSLFPAYAAPTAAASFASVSRDTEWLQNPSYDFKHAETLQQLHRDQSSDITEPIELKDEVPLSLKSEHSHHHRKRAHTPDSDDISSSASDESGQHRHKHKKKSKKKKKSKHKHHKHHGDESKQRRPHDDKSKHHKHAKDRTPTKDVLGTTSSKCAAKLPEYPPGKVFIEEIPGLTPELAFRFDRKPDMDNIAYGTIYKTHIAKYRRCCNIPLGLSDGQMIFMGDKQKERAKSAINRYYGKENRLSKNDPVQDLSKTVIRQLSQKFSSEKLKQKSFIPVQDAELDPSLQISAKSTDTTDDNLKIKEPENEKIKRQVAEFNHHLGDHPGDIGKWLELVDYQTKAADISEDYQKVDIVHNRESIILDIKASVLEKALEKNPASIELKMQQLQLCAHVWETSKLSKEWKRLTFLHPNNPQVWWHYLKFLTTNIHSFSISTLLKAAGKCFKVLRDVRSGAMLTHPPPPHLEDHMIELFLEVCNITWQSGHTEKACALYQAMLELNLFAPAILQDSSLIDQLDFLEAFWDSSFPRIGEDDALGWGRWVDTKAEVPFSSMYSKEKEELEEEEILGKKESQWHTWVALETSRSSQLWLPWRSDVRGAVSQDECEDPERVVLFDDIKDCIFQLSSPDACLRLVLTFLRTLNVSIRHDWPSLSPISIRKLKTDVQSRDIFGQFPDACRPSDVELSKALSDKVIANLLDQIIPKFTGYSKTMLTVIRLHWKLDQLDLLKDQDAKAWKSACKDIKKFAKSQLKLEENRNNLLVWEAYASLEWKLGNDGDARRVLDTALSMNTTPPQKLTDIIQQSTLCRLYRVYSELEMGIRHCNTSAASQVQHRQRCLHVLTLLAIGEQFHTFIGNVPPPSILKARKGYQQYLEVLLQQHEAVLTKCSEQQIRQIRWIGPALLHWTVCYAIFQYLTVNLQAANAVFQQTLSSDFLHKLQARDKTHKLFCIDQQDCYSENTLLHLSLYEDLTVHQMSLIEYHIQHQVAPLATLRVPLQRALSSLPDESRLLQAYIAMEGRGNIVGQLRRYLVTVSQHSQTALVWLYAVAAELQRVTSLRKHYQQMSAFSPQMAGMCRTDPWESGVRYQLRAWFERALSQPTGLHCVLLWRLYMYCEVQQKQLGHAKSVYYRAAQQCPWAKALYMEAIRYFPELLQEVTDLMVEKEIRLRTPLEELALLMENIPNDEEVDADAERAVMSDEMETECDKSESQIEVGTSPGLEHDSVRSDDDKNIAVESNQGTDS